MSEAGLNMARSLCEEDWNSLLYRIERGNCTPFLGAGASMPRIPLAGGIAEDWAGRYHYPLPDCGDLARVAQFRAVTDDAVRPKEDLADMCRNAAPPDFAQPDEIHRVLAELPLKVYMTTNYDDFMVRALRSCDKSPAPELCPWNDYVASLVPSVFAEDPAYRPSVSNPLVYHLHGSADEPRSMVLTEDDYLDFLVWFSREWSHQDQHKPVFPAPIVRALAGSSLLFIGYSRSDWNFRVLFRGLVGSLVAGCQMKSISVQLTPLPEDASPQARAQAEEYLERYFHAVQKIPLRVFWGSAGEFAAELRQRWEHFRHERGRAGA